MTHEKRKAAAALHYDPGSGKAPQVVASGYGEIAERIIKRAQELNVPIQTDSELAPLLVGLKLNQEIPLELYGVVASLLAIVFAIDTAKP